MVGNVDQTDSLFALESLDDGVSKEERQQRFATQLAENKYLEMQKERPILEAKYIAAKKMADPTVTYTLENAITFIAECQDMCPEFEREDREFSNTLDPFEMLPRDNKLDAPRVDHQKAVKRYKRSGAGDPPPLPSDVRPPLVLKRTLKYLFYDLISTYGLEETNAFIWDRTRAIRNDCILQNNRGVEAIEIHEPIARYHIMCTNALCGTTGYEIRLEVEQLEKTLQSLTEFYKEVRRQNIQSPNEAEFQAYNLLVSPWDPEMGAKLERDLPESLFFDPLIQLAFKIRFSMSRKGDDKIPSEDGAINQFAKIFRLLKSPNTSYLMACCVHLHFKDIRRAAIRAMQRSYWYRDDEPTSGHRLPEIVSLLGFDDESEAINFLQHYKIDVINLNEMSDDQSDTYAYIGRKVGKSGKGDPPIYPFKELIDDPPLQQSILVEMKKPDVSYGDLLLQSHNNIGSRNHSDSFSNMPPKAIPPTSVSSNRTTLKGISSTTSSLSNGELKPSLSVQNGFQSLHNNITPQKTNPTFVKKELTLPVTNQHQTLNTFSNPIPSTILSTAGTPNKTNFSFTAAANSFPISNPNTSRVVESVTSTFIPSPNSFIPISNQTMHKPHKSSPLRPVESTFTQPLPPVFQPPLPTFNPQPALNFTPKLKENTYLPVVSNAPVMPQFQLKQKSPSNIKQSFEKPQIVTQPVQFAAPNHSSLRITTPIKSPLYPQFQNEWANKFLHGLIEDLILQLVVTEHHHIVSNYNDVLVTECIESLIDDIIEETATETLDKSKMLHAFGTSLVFSGNKLISDVVEEMVKLTIFEECENYHLGRYEKYGWDRWRYCILRKNYREQKKMLMQRNMLTCLRQTSAIIPRFAMPKSALPNTINNGLLQAKLFDISKQVNCDLILTIILVGTRKNTLV
ncbi:SAC3/GANP/Nin1/mts3/eIF-3 p25 family-domain-containing protein [Globomyces pollinis-pini]|nr:SAC3/GANP/Nin1/mts3/eIF-3 p25 family-domain-containing protein [Globomyces pollinis-pini]